MTLLPGSSLGLRFPDHQPVSGPAFDSGIAGRSICRPARVAQSLTEPALPTYMHNNSDKQPGSDLNLASKRSLCFPWAVKAWGAGIGILFFFEVAVNRAKLIFLFFSLFLRSIFIEGSIKGGCTG